MSNPEKGRSEDEKETRVIKTPRQKSTDPAFACTSLSFSEVSMCQRDLHAWEKKKRREEQLRHPPQRQRFASFRNFLLRLSF